MPVVQFRSEATAPLELNILMSYPNDERERERALVVHTLNSSLQGDNSGTLTLERSQVRMLLESPSLSALAQEERARAKAGFLAGRLLATLYLCHAFRDSHHYFVPSINKAIYACTQQAVAGGKFGDGSPLPRSDRPIRDAWRSFGPVAHFWAAISMDSLGYPIAPDRSLLTPAYFERFLGVSAAILRFATTFIPEGASPRVPVLDEAKTWELPSAILPVELHSTRIPDLLKKSLQHYRA